MSEASDTREFTRVPVKVRAEVAALGRTIVSSTTQNLSMKGLLVETPERLPDGVTCQITLFLGDGDVQIRAEGNIVHCYPEGIALQFDRILGLESFEHLRNLVLYNAPDPEQVESELSSHTGIRKRN